MHSIAFANRHRVYIKEWGHCKHFSLSGLLRKIGTDKSRSRKKTQEFCVAYFTAPRIVSATLYKAVMMNAPMPNTPNMISHSGKVGM